MRNIPHSEQLSWRDTNFPESQYYKNEFRKTQIVLHHTASGRGTDGDFNHWLTDPKRIATCVIIDHAGLIHRLFDSKYWGHHLGVTSDFLKTMHVSPDANEGLNKHSIGIELDSWGPLVYYEHQYRSYTGKQVKVSDVEEYFPAFKTMPKSPFFDSLGVAGKGAFFYEKYTALQLASLEVLLRTWTKSNGIPTTYNPAMWSVNKEALGGKPGIWTHVSYRQDKSDCHPQPNLIEMLKRISDDAK